MNIKNIMNDLFYSENPKPKLDKTKEDKNTLESRKFSSMSENKKTYSNFEIYKGIEENKTIKKL